MFNTYTPDTVSGEPIFLPCNTFYHSWINPEEFDEIKQLVQAGYSAFVMHGCFDDKNHTGRVGKIDEEKIDSFLERIRDIMRRLTKQCGY